MQQRLSERAPINLDLRVRMPLEPLDEHQIDWAHLLQQVVERWFGCTTQLVHQGPTMIRCDHHFSCPCLPMAPRVLSRLIDVESVMCVLNG